MLLDRSTEKIMMCAKMLRKQRSLIQYIFNFQSIQSITIAMLKTKTGQRTELCKYKTDRSSDGNLLSIRMLKVLYPNTKITDLNKSIDKTKNTENIVIHSYNR